MQCAAVITTDLPGLSTTLPVQKWSPLPPWPNTAPTRALDVVGGGVCETPGWWRKGRAPRIRCADQPYAAAVAPGDGEDEGGAETRVFRAGTSPVVQPDKAARPASMATATADLWRMAGC
ncbi:hypothetical protein GCM10010211_79680 [Streptomyces albospinus]|uniref:Uncharacterized protein n=1 Tax=Streptomyces albospinus TaxID=285515 RepID=A0ABQ2VPP5_9ACTN|nr:hypothetical protein GCM10010211_79680 [Streptomyces albospinus]